MDSVLILPGRCSWSRCIFCGYSTSEISQEQLKGRMEQFFKKLKNMTGVKVFGSGSFLDDKQVSLKVREYFVRNLKERKIKKLMIESRPEFITDEKLNEFRDLQLIVAIGLEVADDKILKKINKGFTLKNYEDAARILKKHGVKLRTYILVNPPFVKNVRKSLDESVGYALKHSDSIVLINTLPHKNSQLFNLWLNGEWNFLSKKEFFELTKKYAGNKRIEFDAETFRFIPNFPNRLKKPLVGVGEEFLTHPYFEIWQDYLNRWYAPPEKKKVALFLPCSYKKPYLESETHKKIINVLKGLKNRDEIHELMLSNAGVVPREFEDCYPFNSYDWDESKETDEIKKRYIEVTKRRVADYLTSHRNSYIGVVCFLKYDSESHVALKQACDELRIELKNLLSEKTYEKIKNKKQPLQTTEAIADLRKNIK